MDGIKDQLIRTLGEIEQFYSKEWGQNPLPEHIQVGNLAYQIKSVV